MDKQQKNSDRLASLHDRLKESLCKARLVLNGSDLIHNSNDARTRFAKAFQDLVRFAYPSLRMLRKQFNESDLRQILTTSADDLFKSDDGTLSEAEQEILLKLKFNREQGTRISVADLSGMFEKRQYGWPQTATLCLLARLFMRGNLFGHARSLKCLMKTTSHENWNPVLESHQPLRFCKPPPELLGQRDLKLKCGRRLSPPPALFTCTVQSVRTEQSPRSRRVPTCRSRLRPSCPDHSDRRG